MNNHVIVIKDPSAYKPVMEYLSNHREAVKISVRHFPLLSDNMAVIVALKNDAVLDFLLFLQQADYPYEVACRASVVIQYHRLLL